RAVHVVTAGFVIVIRRPVNKQDWIRSSVLLRIDLPAALCCLQVRAAAAYIPMLGERKDLVRADMRLPNIQKTVATQVVYVLEGVSPTVRSGDRVRCCGWFGCFGNRSVYRRNRRTACRAFAFAEEILQRFETRKLFQCDSPHRDGSCRTGHCIAQGIFLSGLQRRLNRDRFAIRDWFAGPALRRRYVNRCRDSFAAQCWLLFNRNAIEDRTVCIDEAMLRLNSSV